MVHQKKPWVSNTQENASRIFLCVVRFIHPQIPPTTTKNLGVDDACVKPIRWEIPACVFAETNPAIRAAWLTLIELSEKTYHCSESFQRDQSCCGVTITQSAMKLVVALFICSSATLIAGFAAATPGKLPDNFYHYCFAKQISDDILPPPLYTCNYWR